MSRFAKSAPILPQTREQYYTPPETGLILEHVQTQTSRISLYIQHIVIYWRRTYVKTQYLNKFKNISWNMYVYKAYL